MDFCPSCGKTTVSRGFHNRRIGGRTPRSRRGSYLIWPRFRVAAAAGLMAIGPSPRWEDEGRVKVTAGTVFGTGGGASSGSTRLPARDPRTEGLERLEALAAGY
jgi:bifunctional pyridoxal-dependent enzyme with beta-cystathionase and maltose regulon repressor activities